MKGACVGRRVRGKAAAESWGVGEGRAVVDKAGGRWCLVQGLWGRSLDFLPLTPQAGIALSKSIHVCREDEAGRGRKGEWKRWESGGCQSHMEKQVQVG